MPLKWLPRNGSSLPGTVVATYAPYDNAAHRPSSEKWKLINYKIELLITDYSGENKLKYNRVAQLLHDACIKSRSSRAINTWHINFSFIKTQTSLAIFRSLKNMTAFIIWICLLKISICDLNINFSKIIVQVKLISNNMSNVISKIQK